MTTQRFKRRCRRVRGRRRCSLRKAGGAKTSSVTGVAPMTVTVPRPGRGGRVAVTLASAAFTAGDFPVPAGSTTRRFTR
jgi:hypothetical protein